MADKKDAAQAYGAAGVTTAVGANRIADAANTLNRAHYDRRIRLTRGELRRVQQQSAPAPGAPRRGTGGLGKGPARRAANTDRTKQIKQLAGKVQLLQGKAKAPLIGRKGVELMTAGGLATGMPALYLGTRSKLEKREPYRRRDFDRDAASAVAGGGAYQGAIYGSKRVDRKINEKIAKDPKHQARYAEHKQLHGNPTKAGDVRWKGLFRSYPKDLPGWQWKRGMAYAGAGKTGIALTGAAATGGVAVNRKISKAAPLAYLARNAHNIAPPVAGLAIGGGTVEARRRQAQKKDRNSSTQRYAGSAVAGAAGYGSFKGYGMRLQDKARAVENTPPAGMSNSKRKKLRDDHYKAHGLHPNQPDIKRQLERNAKVYRTWPAQLQDAPYKRRLGQMSGGRGKAMEAAAVALPAALVGMPRGKEVRKNAALPPGSNKQQRRTVQQVMSPGDKGFHGRAWDNLHPDDKPLLDDVIRQGKRIKRLGAAVVALPAVGAAASYGLTTPVRRKRKKLNDQWERGLQRYPVTKGVGSGADALMYVSRRRGKGPHDITGPAFKPGLGGRVAQLMSRLPEKQQSQLVLGALGTGLTAGTIPLNNEMQRGQDLAAQRRKRAQQKARQAKINKSSSEYGVQTTRVSPLRATEAAVGVTLLGWGGSRLGIVRGTLKAGAKRPSQYQNAFKQAENARKKIEGVTGRGAAMLQAQTGSGFRMRPIEGAIGGGWLAQDAMPIRRKDFSSAPPAPQGRTRIVINQRPMQQGW